VIVNEDTVMILVVRRMVMVMVMTMVIASSPPHVFVG